MFKIIIKIILWKINLSTHLADKITSSMMIITFIGKSLKRRIFRKLIALSCDDTEPYEKQLE